VATDEQLMEVYRESLDGRAFAALYQRQAPMLRRFVQRRLFRQDDVEDIVQQTFLRLHVVRDAYRAGEPLRPWLCTIAGNLVRDHLRMKQRRPELSYELTAHTREEPRVDPTEIEDADPALEAAMAHLSEVTQRIMQEHFVQERPLVEIAHELGEKPTTVRVRLHRGCKRLRDQLAM
jgi:RNA polymerase sigma-70 factor (ECF subfamily)